MTHQPPDQPDAGLFIEHAHPALHLDENALRQLVACVLAAEDRPLHYLGIILTDHATVLDLNQTYLDHDYLTDVLSFPLGDDDDAAIDGEVYIDLDTARERHRDFDVTFEEEAHRYLVHGLLHLIGYDDDTPAARQTMRGLEDRYLADCRNGTPAS